jgi:PAP_fibrillin
MRTFVVLALASCLDAGSSAFVFAPIREQLKVELLDLAAQTKRGLVATPEKQHQIKKKFERLEKLNPTSKPLKSDKINGVWDFKYTTSGSILGKGGFPRVGAIKQMINTANLTAYNSEVVNYFGIKVPRKVTAQLTPQNDRLANVQFKRFSIGPLGFDVPEQFKGSLEFTYLDEDLRLTRGDKGNLFILTRLES